METILSYPKYKGYKIKCRQCGCMFFGPLEPPHGCAYPHYKCPYCGKRITKKIWWKKRDYNEVI